MPPQQTTLSPPPDISDVAPTGKERLLRGLGGAIAGGSGASMSGIDDAIAKEHARRLDQAKMYRNLAATTASQLAAGFDAKTGAPLTPEQEQTLQHQYEAAWAAYEKAAGVSKDTKGALQRAKAIVEHVIGVGRQKRQAQQEQGGGQPTPPPTQDDESTPQGGMQPPPKFDVNQAALQEPVQRAQVEEGMKEQAAGRQGEAQFKQREQFAERAGLQKGTLGYQEYVTTGKFPAQAHLQKAMFIDPRDETGTPQDGSYDPGSGQYVDQKGQPVPGALPANTAMLTPHPFKYLSPDGKLLPGFQVGTGYYDMEMNPLPAGTELYMRGLFGTDTLHDVLTYDAQGNPQRNTLERVSTPIIPGRDRGGATAPSPAAPAGGAAPKAPGGAMTPPPSAGGAPKASQRVTPPAAAPQVDARGRPLGMSASAQRQQAQKVTAVKEGISQIFGDPSNPNLKPLKNYGYLAADKESQKRIAKAWQIIVDESGIEDPEKSGKTMTLLQAYGGFPQALAGALARVKQQVQGEMRPDELEALDATVTAFSTAVALRSLTSASAAQFSVKALERDVPIIGLTAINEAQFNDKLSRLGELANNGLKVLPEAFFQEPETKEALRQRMGIHAPQGKSAAHEEPKRRGAMKPPPSGKETPQQEMRRLVEEAGSAPAPGRP